jgi:hypothetical protein
MSERWKLCEDGKWRDSAGHIRCPHGRRRDQCKECRGAAVCEHGRQRCNCKECGGAGICEHGRRRSACKKCGGSQICEHGRRRDRCFFCRPIQAFKQLLRTASSRLARGKMTKTRSVALSQEQAAFLAAQPCMYCGKPAGWLDRLKNEYGYTWTNAIPCCGPCNMTKGSRHTATSFIELCHAVSTNCPDKETFKARKLKLQLEFTWRFTNTPVAAGQTSSSSAWSASTNETNSSAVAENSSD